VRHLLLALAAAILACPMEAAAQLSSGRSVLTGRVTQAGDTTIALGGADVEIVGTGLRWRANSEGRFNFFDMRPGTYELRVRRIGYQPTSVRVVLEGGRSYEQAVELQRNPYSLTEVRIAGRTLKVPARLEDVYRRASIQSGTFFTRQDIDRLNPYDVESLLNLVPTVYTSGDHISFMRCTPGLSGVSSMNVSASQPSSTVQVYIDGTRVTYSGTSVREALHLVVPRDIVAMEVYTSASRLPAEFLADGCAVVAIWTRSY